MSRYTETETETEIEKEERAQVISHLRKLDHHACMQVP